MIDMVELDARPVEIVDMVEEQLAWLAVLSDSTDDGPDRTFDVDDFSFATPIAHLGGDAYGIVLADRVLAAEVDPRDLVIERPSNRCLAMSLIGQLGSRPRDASFINEAGVWRLRSTSLVPKRQALAWTSGAARGLPLARIQNLTVDGYGRSDASVSMVALHPSGRTFVRDGTPFREGRNALAESFYSGVLVQYARRDAWRVQLSMARDRTGVSLETDAVGARELVRSLDSGSPMRGALVHWVKEHFRRSRKDGADPSFVRSHLRGRTKIALSSGLFATIDPAPTAIAQACNGTRFAQP